MEYYSDILKKWNNAICSNINGPRDHPTKWNKSDKAKYQMMSTICEVLKKKIQMNLQNSNSPTDFENKHG